MSEKINMPFAVAQLSTESLSFYLRRRGWQEMPSRYADRIYFEGEIHHGGKPYQLYLPASRDVPKYRTLLQRAIYLLCGVEDREPSEIILDLLAQVHDSPPEPCDQQRHRIRVRNSSRASLRLRIMSRDHQHHLLPGESVELVCDRSAADLTEIEHTDTGLTIYDRTSGNG